MKTVGGRKVLAARRKQWTLSAHAWRKPEGLKFPRTARIVRRGEFDAVYRTGKRRSNSHFTVFGRVNQLPESRFGFSIQKALGGAVVRNRIRRRVREIVRCHRQEIPAGWDIVIHLK